MSVLYLRPTDVVGSAATITVDTGTEDATYPMANLVDGLLYQPAKLTTKTGSWTLDFTTAQRIDVVALAYHNIDAGATVKFQGNATASWGSPTVDAAIVIPGTSAYGHASMPWKDLTGVSGYTTSGFRYWRLIISSTNSVNLSIGELGMWTPKRALVRGVSPGFTTSDEHREIRHETEYGVLHRYRLGVRRRHWKGSVPASSADLDSLRTWYREAANSDNVALWVPDSTVNDAWWVRLPAEGPEVTSRYGELHEVSLDLTEESGGGV